MRDIVDSLKRSLDQALALPGSDLTEGVLDEVDAAGDRVRDATEDIVRTVLNGAPAPIAELEALQNAFEAGRAALRSPLGKVLYRVHERMRAGLERVTFAQMSRGMSAACSCATWRDVAKGGGLSAVPTFPTSRVVEAVDDQFESYRIHECGVCGSRWLQDFNPDSDPSVTRWWARV